LDDAAQDFYKWGIQNGTLFPHVGAVDSYHCPSDKSAFPGSRRLLRNRSYSLSFYMNGNPLYPQVKNKSCQIQDPANVFCFLDEHEESIHAGVFFLHIRGSTGEVVEASSPGANPAFGGAHWMQLPADRHNQGCNISYADGSVRHRKWLFPKEYNPDDPDVKTVADLQDYRWLQTKIPQR
jgi:prepilin-type processing-associated H-X9-DG protein